MSKYLSASEFFEEVRLGKLKPPKKVKVSRSQSDLTLIWGWMDTIKSPKGKKEFKENNRAFVKQIERLQISEKELRSLLVFWSLYEKNPDNLHASEGDERYPKAP